MNKEEVVKGKNLFDEEKIIDTGIKEPLFIRIPFDEYKELKENNLYYRQELAKAWKENEELKRKTYKAYINDKGEIQFIFDNYISKDKIKEALDYIEENSFEDTTGVVLNLKDESYWELWKLLKGDE